MRTRYWVALVAVAYVACHPTGLHAHARTGQDIVEPFNPSAIGAASARGQEGGVPKRPLGRDLPVFQPAPGDTERREAPAIVTPTGQLTLQEALALALVHNPALSAFAWESRALEARMVQAGRPPNPTLDVMVEDLAATRFPGTDRDQPVQSQTTLQLSQLIELGGKRTARVRLAQANLDLAAWDYETARIDVLTQVSRAFTDVLAAQETLAVSEETTRLVTQVRENVGARVTAGTVSPIEETRAGVALAAVRADAARARRALDANRTKLALLWGSPVATFDSAAGDLKAEPPPLPAATALTMMLNQNPELARWAAELTQREASLAVEQSRRQVDVAVSAGYRRFTTVDGNAFVVGASLPLPFFDKNKGGIEEARIRVAAGYEQQRAAAARVKARLADAYAALAGAHDEATILRTDALPGAQQTFEAVTEGYRLGRFGLLDVLDAQRTLIAVGGQYVRALTAYQQAVADVERLIGAPLPTRTAPVPNAKE